MDSLNAVFGLFCEINIGFLCHLGSTELGQVVLGGFHRLMAIFAPETDSLEENFPDKRSLVLIGQFGEIPAGLSEDEGGFLAAGDGTVVGR